LLIAVKEINMSNRIREIELQRKYYAETAKIYEDLHVHQSDEHYIALAWLAAMIEHYQFRSVLDLGSGTGRCLRYLKEKFPNLHVVGIEPSAELRKVGYEAGLNQDELVDGDATNLEFKDNSFDIVCEFGVLHHIKQPRQAIGEMLRVAKGGIFISDDNHFACGSLANRLLKRLLKSVGLWNVAYLLRTGGKGYRISDGDGLSYAYSVFDDLEFIHNQCNSVYVSNTKGVGKNLYASAQNVALFGLKHQPSTSHKQEPKSKID
jgi:ubiquinone/menaquinone biosynthesis C-methylase UbiE